MLSASVALALLNLKDKENLFCATIVFLLVYRVYFQDSRCYLLVANANTSVSIFTVQGKVGNWIHALLFVINVINKLLVVQSILNFREFTGLRQVVFKH